MSIIKTKFSKYFFNSNSKLSTSKKEEINKILYEISESFVNHLSQSNHNTTDIDKKTENISCKSINSFPLHNPKP